MDKIIFGAILVIFPFGQLFKIGFVSLFDFLVLVLAILTFLKKPKYPKWYKYFGSFLAVCFFGLILNYQLVTIRSVLYLVRLFSYSMVSVSILNNSQIKKTISNPHTLISLTVVACIFGWIQYLFWPDLTSLKFFNWDDHYYRMVGTFLDPGFFGMILVLGATISIFKKRSLVSLFLLLSLAFTYSRTSFVALLAVLVIFLVKTKDFKKFITFTLFFVSVILLLPKNIGGEGVNLQRTASVGNRLENYKQTFDIIRDNPVLGVGFNNICSYKGGRLTLHSCFGADSSLLFILATSGAVGLVVFIYFLFKIEWDVLSFTSFVAILVHSFFSNTLFYPFVMFWIFVSLGSRRIHKSKV